MNKKDKIKVLQISSGLNAAGLETFIVSLYENIDKNKIDMKFFIASKNKQHYEDRIIDQGGVLYRTDELHGIYNKFKYFINLIKLLKSEKFDVVHCHMDFFNGINLLAAYIAKVPVRIAHSHRADSSYSKTIEKGFVIKAYRKIMRSLISVFATYRLGCSYEANIFMYGKIKYKNQEDIRIINNGINIERFKECKYCTGALDIYVDKNKVNLITIGRICKEKNSLFIIKIINELRNIREDIHLYWVGKGPEEKNVKELINKYKLWDYITFLGVRDDIDKLLSFADFMIFPSLWEGLGIVLIEAQAAGTPCFISDTIPDAANLGLCTTIPLSCNEKVWAENIHSYIKNNNFNNEIDNAKLSKFNIKDVAKEMEEIYINKFN